jgi:hypothetical protein
MTKVKFEAGAQLDFVSPGELDRSLDRAMAQARAAEQLALAGIKHRKLPVLSGYAVAGALDIGGDNNFVQVAGPLTGTPAWNGQPIGPTGGNAWMAKRLAVTGLASGDVVQLFQPGGHSQDIVWQFTSAAPVNTFGRGEVVLYAGETLRLVNFGAFTSTAQIRLSGELYQAPAEMIGKLI